MRTACRDCAEAFLGAAVMAVLIAVLIWAADLLEWLMGWGCY